MTELQSGKDERGLRVRFSPWFKLKRIPGRHFMAIDFKKGFGFIPEMVIIERDPSRSNVIRVNAVLTPEEIKKEDKELAERQKKREEYMKKINKQIEADKKKAEKAKGGKKDGSSEQKPASKEEKA